jgi:hypothetical protein
MEWALALSSVQRDRFPVQRSTWRGEDEDIIDEQGHISRRTRSAGLVGLALAVACGGSDRMATTSEPVGPSVVAPAPDLVAPTSTVDVLTFQYDLSRTGVTSHETTLTPATVSSAAFGKVATYAVDGYVYAQPLYVTERTVAGTAEEVLFVATQHDSVYAFDASGVSTTPLWKVSLLESGETPVPAADTKVTDIVPEIGITGTPVIDRVRELLYVVSKAKRRDGTYVQRLHALRLVDGREGVGSPVEIAASLPGTSPDSVGGVLAFEPLRHNQRSALALIAGHVVIAWASHGDVQPYHGWLMAYDTADLTKPPAAFVTTPNGLAGGIWMGASGPSADAAGNIYVSSGNGAFQDESDDERTSFGLSSMVLRLDGGKLTVKDWFSPLGTDALNAGDRDFGTTGSLLLPSRPGPSPRRLVVAGKTGIFYVLDRDDMGHFDGETDRVVQTFSVGSGFLISNPVFFENRLYVCPHKSSLAAYALDPATGMFGEDAVARATSCAGCFARGSTPTISANGTKDAIVWVIDNTGFATSLPATLHAYDVADLTRELYTSPTSANDPNAAAPAVKFTVPTVANGHVFVGGQGAVMAYGLRR